MHTAILFIMLWMNLWIWIELLVYYQKFGNAKVPSTYNKVLYDWIKNQRFYLRKQLEGEGEFAKDPRYMKFLACLGVTHPWNLLW